MRAGRLNQTTPAASTTHFVFTRNLSYGVTGNDVKELQQFLIQENKGPAAQKLKAHGTTLAHRRSDCALRRRKEAPGAGPPPLGHMPREARPLRYFEPNRF